MSLGSTSNVGSICSDQDGLGGLVQRAEGGAEIIPPEMVQWKRVNEARRFWLIGMLLEVVFDFRGVIYEIRSRADVAAISQAQVDVPTPFPRSRYSPACG
jgi:hypothetical protein